MPDFDGIFDRLDGPELDLPGRDYTELATALRRILQWLVKPSKNSSSDLATMGKRIVCLAWAIDPSIFDRSQSLRQLAREHQQHEKDLRRQVQRARRAIGFTGFGGASRRHLAGKGVES